MSEIDDNIVTNTKKRRKHPLFLAAVTAAALAVIMGCAIVHEYRDSVTINNKETIDYNYTVKENVIVPTHEELLEMGAEYVEGDYRTRNKYNISALPSEIFNMINIDPLMNDNFAEYESDITFSVFNIVVGETREDDKAGQFEVRYPLYDKNIGKTAKFTLTCKVDERAGWSLGVGSSGSKIKYEIIGLNDGSEALLFLYEWKFNSETENMYTATFSYDGMIYSVEINNSSYDEMKQVLDDLGIL